MALVAGRKTDIKLTSGLSGRLRLGPWSDRSPSIMGASVDYKKNTKLQAEATQWPRNHAAAGWSP